tara:strand:- start:79 stop:564 length:486 start_codon:yes stop_codon:yes gene_type:complete
MEFNIVFGFMRYVQLEFYYDQNNENFDKTSLGGFCTSCSKEVIDYSDMSLDQVKKYIKLRPGGCGKFNPEHTDPNLIAEQKAPKTWFVYGMSLTFLFGIQYTEVNAQQKVETTLVEIINYGAFVPHNHRNTDRICPKPSFSDEHLNSTKKPSKLKRRLYIT